MSEVALRAYLHLPGRSWLASAQRALACITLCAFILQGLVAQTHIHGAAFGPGSGLTGFLAQIAAGEERGEAGKSPAKAPAKDDSLRCPFYQAGTHSGVFVAPGAALLLAPQLNLSFVLIATEPVAAIRAVSHAWHGRAPPTC
ncbi:MAG: hypothetical protein JOZ55_10470 [Alphaproteobacteria bacterium]|nr:hypothetical protein [Alphaproteobacteria bacterium]